MLFLAILLASLVNQHCEDRVTRSAPTNVIGTMGLGSCRGISLGLFILRPLFLSACIVLFGAPRTKEILLIIVHYYYVYAGKLCFLFSTQSWFITWPFWTFLSGLAPHELCFKCSISLYLRYLRSFCSYLINILGGKGEGAAGIFEAWDVNYDGKITVQEVTMLTKIKIGFACARAVRSRCSQGGKREKNRFFFSLRLILIIITKMIKSLKSPHLNLSKFQSPWNCAMII